MAGLAKKAVPTAPHPEPGHAPQLPILLDGYGGKAEEALQGATRVHEGTPRPERRSVECFDCHTVHKAARSATSSQCSSCGAYIDLRDVEIKDRTTQRIRTRGDVVIQKKGVALGTAVHCGNLTVFGQVSGSVYAQEEVHLKTSTKVLGEIRCRRLVIDRKCDVQCVQPVHAEEVVVHGTVAGSFFAARRVVVGKSGILSGGLTTVALRVEPGGMVNGAVRVSGTDRRQAATATGVMLPAVS